MAGTQQWIERGKRVLTQNYGRLPFVMERGQGALLWDADGRRYIDLFAGFGGSILGHAHPVLMKAAADQAGKLWHVGNLMWNEPSIELAETLNRLAFAGTAFFAHGGADANEAACKLARLRGNLKKPGRNKIIALHHSFHGRTMAMLSATGSAKYRQGFEPAMPGFVHVHGGDFAELEAAVDEQTCGILMEPILGEGGVVLWPDDYAWKVRQLCDKHEITLIFDEVWTGGGRTGKWFGFQHFAGPNGEAIEPDVLDLGKAVGGGLPVGIMFAKPHVAAALTPGKHASTLGGNAICMAVSKSVFDVIEKENLLAHAQAMGEHAMKRLRSEPKIAGKIAEVRGRGLMIGIELKTPAPADFIQKALERGIVLNVTAEKVVRLAPPVNIPRELWDEGLDGVIELIAAI